MSYLDPLPPDLRALFDEEREAYPENPDLKARVHRRLEAAILLGAVAAGVAGAATKASKTSAFGFSAAKHAKAWIALSLVTGVVVGETHARLSTPTGPQESAIVHHSPAPRTPSSSKLDALDAAEDSPAVPVTSLPLVRPSPSAAVSSTGTAPGARASDLALEQRLVDTARSALARGRGEDALRAVDEHARRFPQGRLAEEREMLAIQALLLVGNRSGAEQRAQRFHSSYPQSMYGAAVDALLTRDDGSQ
jgi:hypothetical protein